MKRLRIEHQDKATLEWLAHEFEAEAQENYNRRDRVEVHNAADWNRYDSAAFTLGVLGRRMLRRAARAKR